MTPDEVQTTLPPTTTTAMRSLVAGLTKLHPTCGLSSFILFLLFFFSGDPAKTYKIAENVKIGCNEIGCKFFCPKKMRPSITKVGCNKKWAHFVPKRLKVNSLKHFGTSNWIFRGQFSALKKRKRMSKRKFKQVKNFWDILRHWFHNWRHSEIFFYIRRFKTFSDSW